MTNTDKSAEPNSLLYDIIYQDDKEKDALIKSLAKNFYEKIRNLSETERILMKAAGAADVATQFDWHVMNLDMDRKFEECSNKEITPCK